MVGNVPIRYQTEYLVILSWLRRLISNPRGPSIFQYRNNNELLDTLHVIKKVFGGWVHREVSAPVLESGEDRFFFSPSILSNDFADLLILML